MAIKKEVIHAFKSEFGFIEDKFKILDLLAEDSPMDYKIIEYLKLPSEDFNIVWHPGVYVFLGNDSVFRVGVSMNNSRKRVMQHLEVRTQKDGCCIWDINKFDDKSILLFNVKNKNDKHWLLALEAFFEMRLNPIIKAGRVG